MRADRRKPGAAPAPAAAFAIALAMAAAFQPLVARPAFAVTGEDPAASLRETEERLEGERRRQRELDAAARDHELALAEARARLITLADQAARNETDLNEIEATLALLADEEKANLVKLAGERHRVAALLGALQRLSRVPPEAALARPDSPVDILRSALLLRDTVPALRLRADQLAHTARQLAEIRQQMEEQRAAAETTRGELHERRREMDRLIETRAALSRETAEERAEAAKRVARLVARTGDLRQLMEKVEAARRADAEAARRREAERLESERRLAEARAAVKPPPPPVEPSPAPSSPAPPPLPATSPPSATAPAKDTPRLPVGGRITVGFGGTDRLGAESRGAHIAGRPGAAVVAPRSGSIMYAGAFRNFGLIVIVEHEGGHHSLLAGLGSIGVTVGEHVAAGEPVGTLPDDEDAPELYFELRRAGQPIDPERGLRAMGR